MNSKFKKLPGRPSATLSVLSPLKRTDKRLLDSALQAEIHRLEHCRKHIGKIDQEVFQAGISCFESAKTLALWLSAPTAKLGGKAPIRVLSTRKGRKDILNLLQLIEDGGY